MACRVFFLLPHTDTRSSHTQWHCGTFASGFVAVVILIQDALFRIQTEIPYRDWFLKFFSGSQRQNEFFSGSQRQND